LRRRQSPFIRRPPHVRITPMRVTGTYLLAACLFGAAVGCKRSSSSSTDDKKDDTTGKKNNGTFTVSKETTYANGPLDKDGAVDGAAIPADRQLAPGERETAGPVRRGVETHPVLQPIAAHHQGWEIEWTDRGALAVGAEMPGGRWGLDRPRDAPHGSRGFGR